MAHFLSLRLTLTLAFMAAWMTHEVAALRKPNIILIMGDDIGQGDYQDNDPTMATPSLTKLRKEGLKLDQMYTLQTCTPTRSATLTGRYPFTFGLQTGKIKGTARRYLNPDIKLLPALLQEQNYTTYAVGKWHLGFCDWSLTPTFRGFDKFFGMYSGAQGYFTHSGLNNQSFDFRDDMEPVADQYQGQYATELHSDYTIKKVINRWKPTQDPFFVYLAFQNAHAPFEAKQRYIDDYCSHVNETDRKIHCAMVAALDEAVGNITKKLKQKNMYDDTVILYFADNGSPKSGGGCNYPYRGGKSTLYEGGTKNYAVLSYPALVNRPGQVHTGLIHVSDWFPTLLRFAQASPAQVQNTINDLKLDGLDQFDSLVNNAASPRTNMVYNIDDRNTTENQPRSAVRIGEMKLLQGHPPGSWKTCPYFLSQGLKNKFDKETRYLRLYNLTADPTELTNLAYDPAYSTIVEQLQNFTSEEMKRLVPFPKEVEFIDEGSPKYYSRNYSPGWCCEACRGRPSCGAK